jgi:3-methyladenine DNA glycosylase AlkC
MESGSSLKDALFNKKRVEYLAGLFVAVDSKFDSKGFVKATVGKFPELELKARIVWIAEVLERYLPADPSVAMKLIVAALPLPLDPTLRDDDFGEFILAPLGEYVVRNGLSKKYLKQSLTTLREITMRFSMEDAMRSFLNTFPDETLAAYDKWVTDKNYHVRRLVSESTRPLLPWSRRLTLDYHIPVKYLDQLSADTTRYVTRSVANHLNDISKRDPDLVLKTLAKWKREGRQDAKELAWMTRHSLRTLTKQGHAAALASIGYLDNHEIRVIDFSHGADSGVLKLGDKLALALKLQSFTNSLLRIDYEIDFVKANGKSKPKVFAWKKVAVTAQGTLSLTKSHHFKSDATTFTLYPGEHTITLRINGKPFKTIHLLLSEN